MSSNLTKQKYYQLGNTLPDLCSQQDYYSSDFCNFYLDLDSGYFFMKHEGCVPYWLYIKIKWKGTKINISTNLNSRPYISILRKMVMSRFRVVDFVITNQNISLFITTC